jgi:polyhydroxyalkanoate synthase subunit PhaE
VSSAGQFPWEDLTGKWRELFEEQTKVAQMWRDSQEQLAKALAGASTNEVGEPGARADAFADLWRLGMASGPMMSGLPGLDSAGAATTTLGRMLEPLSLSLMGGNQVSEAIRGMTEGPRLADVGSVERLIARVMELYVEMQAAARGYEAFVAGAWMEANQSFAATAAKKFTGSGSVEPMHALKTWLGIADEVLAKTHRSSAFLEAQRRLLRAGMDFLLAERELVETLVAPTGLPTRSEMDELHRTVHALKRQVRALGRDDTSPARTGTKPAAKKATSRSRSSARKSTAGEDA